MGNGGGKIEVKGWRGRGHRTKTIAQVGRGEKRWELRVIEAEINSNAETQRALRIRREEKDLIQRGTGWSPLWGLSVVKDHGEFGIFGMGRQTDLNPARQKFAGLYTRRRNSPLGVHLLG